MDISSISSINSNYINNTVVDNNSDNNNSTSFSSILNSAIGMISETNSLINSAETSEINYMLGYTDNLHDVMVAQQKANVSLQYTVQIRNKILDAYKELMNIQM